MEQRLVQQKNIQDFLTSKFFSGKGKRTKINNGDEISLVTPSVCDEYAIRSFFSLIFNNVSLRLLSQRKVQAKIVRAFHLFDDGDLFFFFKKTRIKVLLHMYSKIHATRSGRTSRQAVQRNSTIFVKRLARKERDILHASFLIVPFQ